MLCFPCLNISAIILAFLVLNMLDKFEACNIFKKAFSTNILKPISAHLDHFSKVKRLNLASVKAVPIFYLFVMLYLGPWFSKCDKTEQISEQQTLGEIILGSTRCQNVWTRDGWVGSTNATFVLCCPPDPLLSLMVATTLVDLLLIELMSHISYHVKQMHSQPINLTHELILWTQITIGKVDFSKSPCWHQVWAHCCLTSVIRCVDWDKFQSYHD